MYILNKDLQRSLLPEEDSKDLQTNLLLDNDNSDLQSKLLSNKKWVIITLIISLVLSSLIGAITVVIDPYFHYHKPLSNFKYPINNQRYQNDGIVKHFDYNAIITGTSMTENFKSSEFNQLFNVTSVKVPFAGGSYKEINDNLIIATKHNPNIKIILRCLDYENLLDTKDAMRYEDSYYPKYLYDDLWYNDVNYIFNKSVLIDSYNVINNTKNGGVTTDFDTYSNWMRLLTFGKDTVNALYTRPNKSDTIVVITDEDYKNITENITQNVTALADKYPQIEFYLFFPPYSIYYWDSLNQLGTMERQLAAEKYAIELLLGHNNIRLFSFSTEFETISDLNNYRDMIHYGEDINSQILMWINGGTHQLTLDNYQSYCEQLRNFYTNYNYDMLFQN